MHTATAQTRLNLGQCSSNLFKINPTFDADWLKLLDGIGRANSFACANKRVWQLNKRWEDNFDVFDKRVCMLIGITFDTYIAFRESLW